MAGRPRAPIFIVNNVNPAIQLTELDMNHRDLVAETAGNLLCVEFCARWGLIHNSYHCGTCNIDMSFVSNQGE